MFASWPNPTMEMIEMMGMKNAKLPLMILLFNKNPDKPKD